MKDLHWNALFKVFIISFLAIPMFYSCVDREFDFQLTETITGKKMMVLATLDNNLPLVVLLSNVLVANGQLIDYAVADAMVILYENDIAIDTLERLVLRNNNSPLYAGIYFSQNSFSLAEGADYHISATALGYDGVESEKVRFQKIFGPNFDAHHLFLDTVSFARDSAEVHTVFDFELVASAQGELLLEPIFKQRERNTDFDFGTVPLLISFNSNSEYLIFGTPLGINLGPGTYRKDVYRGFTSVRQINQSCKSVIHRTEHFLKFAKPFKEQERELIGGLSATPARLPNNMIGGYGYFSVRDRVIDCNY
jgi:hypothetical protein